MPKGDNTGPEGKGPKTGRALGKCAGNEKAGYLNNAPRQGAGRGPRNGQGRGFAKRGFRQNQGFRQAENSNE